MAKGHGDPADKKTVWKTYLLHDLRLVLTPDITGLDDLTPQQRRKSGFATIFLIFASCFLLGTLVALIAQSN